MTIYDYVLSEEANFQTEEVVIADNWRWNFREHVQLLFHLKNGVFYTGSNDYATAFRYFKGVMEPMLNLNSWTEDIEVKDVAFFIESKSGKVLSFLVKKYHDEVYTRENDLDTLFDEITDDDLGFGGVVVQKGKDMPERLHLNTIAFCDQTDLLGGPIGFKFNFSLPKLRSMSKIGWGNKANGATVSIEELCVLATPGKEAVGTRDLNENQTPGKSVPLYIVHGTLPEDYLYDNGDPDYSCTQIQIIAYYVDKKGKKNGVTLYRKKSTGDELKFFSSNPIFQRALGRGVGESLLPDQVFSNWAEYHKMNLIKAGSKIPLVTDDESYTNKNKINDMESLEITTIAEGKKVMQVPTAAPANVQLLNNAIDTIFSHAQLMGAAFDPILGKEPVSGTTFRGQERTVAQGQGLHTRRRGKRAKFIEELYRDWIIPDIKKDILKGKKFMATLSTEELSWVAEQLAINESNHRLKEKRLNGKVITQEEQKALIQTIKNGILAKGNKHLLEILKNEFEETDIKMGINVAGKQKDLAQLSDKLLSIFQFVFANPQAFKQAMQIPALAKAFEDILEFGNLSIADFSSLLTFTDPQQAGAQDSQPAEQTTNQPAPSMMQAPQPQS